METLGFILGFFSIAFAIFAVLTAYNIIPILPVYKLGIPFNLNNVKWTWFIYKNMRKFKRLDDYHFSYDGKVIWFMYPWLYGVYIGNSAEDIKYKYSLGGQSNRACYLTWYEKIIGRKIEKWYLVNAS